MSCLCLSFNRFCLPAPPPSPPIFPVLRRPERQRGLDLRRHRRQRHQLLLRRRRLHPPPRQQPGHLLPVALLRPERLRRRRRRRRRGEGTEPNSEMVPEELQHRGGASSGRAASGRRRRQQPAFSHWVSSTDRSLSFHSSFISTSFKLPSSFSTLRCFLCLPFCYLASQTPR